jgi:hypothetical protein
MLVKNLHGTSDNYPPNGYSSWLDFWKKKQGMEDRKRPYCRKCKQHAEVGAHVKKVSDDDGKWYITPLCNKCNKSEDNFMVNPSDLIPVN